MKKEDYNPREHMEGLVKNKGRCNERCMRKRCVIKDYCGARRDTLTAAKKWLEDNPEEERITIKITKKDGNLITEFNANYEPPKLFIVGLLADLQNKILNEEYKVGS